MKRLLSIAFIATTLFACSKSDSDELNYNGCTIKEISNTEPSKTNFNYNSEGKIIKASYNIEGQIYNYEISYLSDKIIITETLNSTLSDTYIYSLQNGRISRKASSQGEDHFFYRNDGYLNKITYYGNIDVKIVYTGGNLSQLESEFDYVLYDATYSNDLRVPFSEFHFGVFTEWGPTALFEDAILYEQGYFGKKSKNQISKLRAGKVTDNYSFTKDGEGKILSGKSDHYNLSFKYDCK